MPNAAVDLPERCKRGICPLWTVSAPRTTADLRHCLASAISTVAAAHTDTCNATHTGTPSATVAIVRERDNVWD
ncbi:MAG: hypothetical protein ACR2H2_09240 [Solirubrobacteraceae bacterium]